MDERARLQALLRRVGSMEPSSDEVAPVLLALLDLEERVLLPALDLREARGIVQELRYLRNRSAELARTVWTTAVRSAFVSEVRAHAQRSERLYVRHFER
jgi:hypothetical protein